MRFCSVFPPYIIFFEISKFVLKWRFHIGCVLILALAILLPIFYTPYWQSEDDAWISMLIKGYGIAEASSILTTNSNFLWALTGCLKIK